MGKYNLKQLARDFFPWFWQNDPNLALIDVTVDGVFDETNENLATKENEIIEKTGYSIQRLSLETSLNNRFDPIFRGIIVSNGSITGTNYVYKVGEVILPSDEIYVYQVGEVIAPTDETYVYKVGESEGGSVTGFTVVAPIGLQGEENEIRAWVEFVLIYGTEYILIFA